MGEQAASTSAGTVLFDTDILIWYVRGHERARRFLARVAHRQRAVSSLTVMELLQGCRKQAEVRHARTFVAENFAQLLHPEERVSLRAIDLLARHAMAHGLRVVDALIAASALEMGWALATANTKPYRPIPRLRVIGFKPSLE